MADRLIIAPGTDREESVAVPTFNPLPVRVVGGAGYVGTVTSVGLAALGHDVVAMDTDAARIRALQTGAPPFHEEGLTSLLRHCLDAGTLHFTTSLSDAPRSDDVILIAVGTPLNNGNGMVDLSQIVKVAENLAATIEGYTVIVVKSTVPVGAIDLITSILSRHKTEGRDFDIVANPEFLREGHGLEDFFRPDRIVVGSASERAKIIVRLLYQPVIDRQVRWGFADDVIRAPVPVVETDAHSALMAKYAANAFLAVRISFINEIAGLCERFGADVRDVIQSLGYDPRIGSSYLNPGLGFGGPCLEKDLQALITLAEQFQYDPKVLRATLARNAQQMDDVLFKIKQMSGQLLYGRIVAVFGLAFKPHTDDVRNSLSVRLIHHLQDEGAIVHAYDPHAPIGDKGNRPETSCFDDPYEAVKDAEVLVLATEWPEFSSLDFGLIGRQMSRQCIVDARNVLDPATMRSLGFRYQGMGHR